MFAIRPVPGGKAVAPICASFSVHPPSITAGVATNITWSFQYANQPWPDPSCSGGPRGRPHARRSDQVARAGGEHVVHAHPAPTPRARRPRQAKINVVKIEAKFDVAEYQILILCAKEATRARPVAQAQRLQDPRGRGAAAPALLSRRARKFFVAKVDPRKVQMVNGRVALSPLRFHYDSQEFALPIRLGLANSLGPAGPDRQYPVSGPTL